MISFHFLNKSTWQRILLKMQTDTESISQRGGALRKVVKVSLTVVLPAIVGAAVMFAYLRHKQDPYSWHQLEMDKTSYKTEALFDSDIPLPDIKNISGQLKFRTGRDKANELEAGYVVEFDIDKLDKAKLPEKYRKPTVYQSKQGEYTVDPVEEVVYVAKFQFTLQDKDRFDLLKTSSEDQYIQSGKRNRFQGLATDPIPLEIAQRAKFIKAEIHVVKCETCR
jgi:hypothetical protein